MAPALGDMGLEECPSGIGFESIFWGREEENGSPNNLEKKSG
jgi:hypothetical protein